MTPAFERLQQQLKQLPGVGYRSAERMALHLLVGKPGDLSVLVNALEEAARTVRRCSRCGNLAEGKLCEICADNRRDQSIVCVVENVPDLVALERSAAYRGVYHVLHGKLSPIHGVAPTDLNLSSLLARTGRKSSGGATAKVNAAESAATADVSHGDDAETNALAAEDAAASHVDDAAESDSDSNSTADAAPVRELILALSNDVEGEATCHYITEHLPRGADIKVTRIGFGLPSGGGVLYADSVTLKSALDARRSYS